MRKRIASAVHCANTQSIASAKLSKRTLAGAAESSRRKLPMFDYLDPPRIRYFLDASFSRSSRFQLSTMTACDCSPALFITRNRFPSGITS